MSMMIESRFPGAHRRGTIFDRETKAEALYTVLGAVLDQIDYTNQACRPNEPVGGVLDPHLIAKAHKALRDFRASRDPVDVPRMHIPGDSI